MTGEICPRYVLLVRHGETDYTRDGRLQGWTDVPLNARGVQQAVALSKAIAHRGRSIVYSSPLRRAQMTASLIARELGCPTVVLESLKERGFGPLEGTQTPLSMADQVSTVESRPKLMARVGTAWATIAKSGGYSTRAVVVTHLEVIACIGRLLGLWDDALARSAPPASTFEIELGEHGEARALILPTQ